MHIHSQQHLMAEEIADTLFFCTGLIPSKMKSEDGPMLYVGNKLIVSLRSFKDIRVNGYRCKSSYEAKLICMQITE